MFDVGFSELLVIGAVALLVIGPERMPGVARTIGALIGRMQRYVADVKSEITREMRLEELQRLQSQVTSEVQAISDLANKEIHDAEVAILEAAKNGKALVSDPSVEHETTQVADVAHDTTPEEPSATLKKLRGPH